ncbi:MAG TPA: ABC transporter substrate-binding protein [Mycobacteriales bacterium]|nr:ABC transporter substrate-binding protein [Mycobacteriales bacterium]
MKSPVRTWRTVAVVAATGLALAACGGSDDNATDGTTAAPSASADAGQQVEADGALKLGTLLPQTGSLASLGPPEIAGVALAVQEINEAGGVLGQDVTVIDADSGDTSTNIASQSVDRLLSENVDVIIGAASSGVSKTVIDKITGAGVVQFSPANTSPDFTDYPDRGLYWRTAPSDVLQGRILGDLVIEDGNATVGILALQDAYGTGLADNVERAVTGSNGEVVEKVIYDPKAAEYSAEVGQVAAADPDAIVLIGFEESGKIVQELVKQGIGPQQGKKLYLVDGNVGQASLEELPAGTLEGVQGTVPGAETASDFRDRLLAIDPSLTVFSYAAESYDAAILSALAAIAAESDAGTDIAANLEDVSKGGTKCTAFAECKELLEAGEDIDYDGVSGPVEFDENGDPTEASVGIYTYDAQNKVPAVAQVYKSGTL